MFGTSGWPRRTFSSRGGQVNGHLELQQTLLEQTTWKQQRRIHTCNDKSVYNKNASKGKKKKNIGIALASGRGTNSRVRRIAREVDTEDVGYFRVVPMKNFQ